jgi:hypothetical protein
MNLMTMTDSWGFPQSDGVSAALHAISFHLRRRVSLEPTKEDRKERRPIRPSEIALAGLLMAVGRGRMDVALAVAAASVGSVLIVGLTALRLDEVNTY